MPGPDVFIARARRGPFARPRGGGMVRWSSRALLGALAVFASACLGVIADVGADPSDPDRVAPEIGAGVCNEGTVAPSPLRTLSRLEYDNTIAQVLGDTNGYAERFPSDVSLSGFTSGVPVSELSVTHFVAAAEEIAAAAVQDLETLVPCDLTAGGGACAEQFVIDFGRRTFRRPLDRGEVETYLALYRDAELQYDSALGIQLVVQTMLSSPHFLYHLALGYDGEGADSVPLSSFELASRLSFFLFRTTPDDELLDKAEAGVLDTDSGYRAEIERMLQDDRAKAVVEDFHMQWLGLGSLEDLQRDAAVQPGFDDTYRDAMRAETMRFADFVIREGDGSLYTLLTADFSFPEGPVVDIYGLDPATLPPEGEPVPLDSRERAGILTHPSVLATHSFASFTSPIHRGVFVRENVLCSPPPAPPANIPPLPPLDPDVTGRDRFAAHSSDPACTPCHSLIDPPGFAFEKYDAVGRFRVEESGEAIDATGEIVEAGDANGAFADAVDLMTQLADTEQVRGCMQSQWYRFALGRSEVEADACAVESIGANFRASDGNIRELLVAIMTSAPFVRRAPIAMEGP